MAEKKRVKEPYVRIGDRVARTGEYELVEPLDSKILEVLPEEGQLFANLYPLGETVPNIAKKLGSKELGATLISSRLRVMSLQGLVLSVKSIGGHHGRGATVWQRTTSGSTYLKTKEKTSGDSRGS